MGSQNRSEYHQQKANRSSGSERAELATHTGLAQDNDGNPTRPGLIPPHQPRLLEAASRLPRGPPGIHPRCAGDPTPPIGDQVGTPATDLLGLASLLKNPNPKSLTPPSWDGIFQVLGIPQAPHPLRTCRMQYPRPRIFIAEDRPVMNVEHSGFNEKRSHEGWD